MGLPPTPSQTVGPYFKIGTDDGFIGPELVAPNHPGAVRLFGFVTDGEGAPVVDAMIEIWQANAAGRYAHPEDTRVYFPDEAEANGADPVLSSIEDADARASLVAVEEGGGLRFDIKLQGDRETTFFAV